MTTVVRLLLLGVSVLALPLLVLSLTANAVQQAGLGAIIGATILALIGLLYALESGNAEQRRRSAEHERKRQIAGPEV